MRHDHADSQAQDTVDKLDEMSSYFIAIGSPDDTTTHILDDSFVFCRKRFRKGIVFVSNHDEVLDREVRVVGSIFAIGPTINSSNSRTAVAARADRRWRNRLSTCGTRSWPSCLIIGDSHFHLPLSFIAGRVTATCGKVRESSDTSTPRIDASSEGRGYQLNTRTKYCAPENASVVRFTAIVSITEQRVGQAIGGLVADGVNFV